MRSFVDTNVWVYGVDAADPDKQRVALSVLESAGTDDLVISAQVLGEFYTVVTRKLVKPVSADEARSLVDRMSRLPVVPIDVVLVKAAIAGARDWQISYWDALIVRAAEAAACDVLLTEDLAAGTTYDRVRTVNPFAST